MLQEFWTTLRSLHNIIINVFCSARKSQQELVSMNCSVSVGVLG